VFQAKLDAIAVPYQGEGPGLAGHVGGQTHFFVGNLAAAIGHIRGGRLRALGVTSKAEIAQLPGVPPIANTIAGFENIGWFGIVAPTGTPQAVIQKVQLDTRKALEDAGMREKLSAQGLSPVGNSPEEMGRAMKAETELWRAVVGARKIQVK
ncbi:MAG: tripartite tricarboxylate transporter substrate binding protein, partial [Betaproteobacteria bacterium]|nr:tripartite tricarboxylate transporter substrate binding protein [Betaproteobacteria bacterium]